MNNEEALKHPFIDYLKEDKSHYKTARECGFIDDDDDFLVGDSGGFLLNWNFEDKFVNTDLIKKSALFYDKYGVYTHHKKGTPEYNKYRREQETLRREGVRVPILIRNGKLKTVHITGAHYGYLNFGRIKLTKDDGTAKKVRRKEEFFPDFWDGDYWIFKIKKFCINNGFNEIFAKARRKGFTYKESWDCVNEINLYPKSVCILAAYLEKYLTAKGGVSDFAMNYISWIENKTPFRRGILSRDWDKGVTLGFKKKRSMIEEGYLSTLWSVTCSTNPSALIGKSADKIKFEEAGNFPNLDTVLDVTISTMEDGSVKSGMFSMYGTGGHEGSNWYYFSSKYYNPASLKAIEFENVWDKSSRGSTCGFFFPNILNYIGFYDKDGNSDLEGALKFDFLDKQRQSKIEKDPTRLSIYIGQRANSPEEAFKQVSEKIFSSPEFVEHVAKVKKGNINVFYRDGILKNDNTTKSGVRFVTNEELASNQDTKKFVHPFINDYPFKKGTDLTGCIREYYPPYTINGLVPSGLYRVWHDPFGAEVEKQYITASHSLQSTYVYMRPNNLVQSKGDILVASYAGRPESQDEVNSNLLKLCKRYNAELLFERNRGEVKKYFQIVRALQYLAKEPNMIRDKIKDGLSNLYGINMTKDLKLKAIIYLRDWLYEEIGRTTDDRAIFNFERIYELPLLEELMNFDGSQNVDRISALLVGMFDKKEQMIKELKIKNPINKSKSNYFNRQLFS